MFIDVESMNTGQEMPMFLIDSFAFLIVLFFLSILFSFVVFSLLEAFCGIFGAMRYPFLRLRDKLAGMPEDTAPLFLSFRVVLATKLLAATIAGAISLFLGASAKTTAIVAAVAFLFLG